MNVNALMSSSTLAFAQQNQQTHRPKPPELTDTAALLGVSAAQLSTDLQSGKTLSSLAASAGVSSSDLLSSVESDLTANAPTGAPSLSGTQLSQMATGIINGTGPGGRGGSGGAGGHGGPAGPPPLTSTASLLGVSQSQLSTDLAQGTTLSSVASTAGVSSATLLQSVEADLKADAPQGAAALSDSQLSTMATNLIDGTGPGDQPSQSTYSTSGTTTTSGNAGVDQYA